MRVYHHVCVMALRRMCWCADVAGVKCERVFYVLQGSFFPPLRAALTEVERLIYRPAGEACLDSFNLKSQPPPNTKLLPTQPLSTCQLSFTAPPAVCEDMRATDLPCTWIQEGPECLSSRHAAAIGVLSVSL